MTDRRPNIPAHAVTAIVAFALGVCTGMIAVLEGWA